MKLWQLSTIDCDCLTAAEDADEARRSLTLNCRDYDVCEIDGIETVVDTGGQLWRVLLEKCEKGA